MRRLLAALYAALLRSGLAFYHACLWLCELRKQKAPGEQLLVIATATFYSKPWIHAHLAPIAGAKNCRRVIMVATDEVPEIEKVEARYPPTWLKKGCGRVGARLLYFSYLCFRLKPDVLVGFHLLLNGLLALLIARLTGRRAVYICGGGPREVRGGGIETENRIFSRLASPSLVIERRLLQAVNKMDAVITMGEGARAYFRERGIGSPVYVIAGGFEEQIYYPASADREYDFILVGRLSQVKRVDRFLGALKQAAEDCPLKAVIVGDGPDRQKLEDLKAELELNDRVHFVGWQSDVAGWMRRSKCTVLTSDSEGLSQALIQALMCGLPAIVSNVGDLSEVVVDEENGFLISSLTEEAFSTAMKRFLMQPALQERLRENAINSSRAFKLEIAAQKWQDVFATFLSSQVLAASKEAR